LTLQKIGIGLIGVGSIAQGVHIPGYRAIPDQCEIIAAADISANTLNAAGRKFEIPHLFDDYHDLLKLDEIDAVSVCASNSVHHPATLAALTAGKHVFCEKPLALNVAEAREMVAAARAADRILAVDFQSRFFAQSELLKGYIERGDLGEIYYVRAAWNRRRGLPPEVRGAFHSKELNGGGALIDIGVHVLDVALWLMGGPRPVAVSGATYLKIGNCADSGFNPWGPWNHREMDVDDFALAMIRLDNGASLILECSWALNIDTEYYKIWLAGDKAGAELELGGIESSRNPAAAPLRIFKAEADTWVDLTPRDYAPVPSPHAAAVADFVRSVREGAAPKAPGEDALRVQEIISAIYASADSGTEVRLD
jgi:predicted dehydrogenase